MKKRNINSGQEHAEAALLKKVEKFLLRCKGIKLTEEMISRQLETITVTVNTSDVNALVDGIADLKPACSMTVNNEHSVTLSLKRPDAWPLGWIGVAYIVYGIFMMYTWDMTHDMIYLSHMMLKSYLEPDT